MRKLIQRAKQEEWDAIEVLYQQVKPTGMKVAVSYVGQEGLEEDMFHEAFMKAIENLDKFDENRSFQSWFDVILANTCKSYLRKNKAVTIQEDVIAEEVSEEISSIGNPEECWDQKELSQIIKELLDGLSDEQKEATILHYYQGKSVAEIAEIQNCGQDTVKSRLFQSRNKLKTSVEEYEKKTKIKLHSIGIGVALFVFFKSGMGDTYACEYLEKPKGAKAGGDKTAPKKMAEEVTKEAGKEAAKAVSMSMAAKIAIAASVVVLLGGVAVGIALSNKNASEDVQASVEDTVENSQESSSEMALAEESTQESEDVEESTELVESTEESTEEETPDSVLAEGITVSEENGIKRITIDMDVATFSTANGGTIITYNENGCGAIDYDGNVLVPNSYTYYYEIPDNQGNFALGTDEVIDVFDSEGNKVHSVYNWQNFYLSEGYATYSSYDEENCVGTVYCYDIANDNLTSHSIESWMHFIRVSDVKNGRYLCSYSDMEEKENEGIFYASTDGTITPVEDGYMYSIYLYGTPYEGYVFGRFTEMEGAQYLFSEDFSEKINISFYGNTNINSFYANGDTYYNKGTQMVITTDFLTDDGTMRCYLMDFEGYDGGNNLDYDNMPEDIRNCILAEYNNIVLSSCGIYYAEDESGNFYLSADGSRIEDAYVNHSAFADKYAAVIDANGLAYLIDSDMNVLTSGYEAEYVYLRGASPCYEGNNTQTLFIVE